MFHFSEDKEEDQRGSALNTTNVHPTTHSPSKQKIDILNSLTKKVDLSEMSCTTNKSKLFSSANNVPNILAPRSQNTLSKSAGDITTSTIIKRIVGFEQPKTYWVTDNVQTIRPHYSNSDSQNNLVTPPEIEHKETSSPISENDINNNSGNNENYFSRATRQNAFSEHSPPYNLEYPEEQAEKDSNANLATDTETALDSYLSPPEENSNTNLEEAGQTEENNNQELVISESSSENEAHDMSCSPPIDYIFGFAPENDGGFRWIEKGEEAWEYCYG